MDAHICRTCGAEYPPSQQPPVSCLICDDERQYVGWGGQRWTTTPQLIADGYRNDVRELEPNLHGIGISPAFGIGQRALLVRTPGGNVLYDCIGMLDETARSAVAALGGISAICLSHPHFYDAMVTWSHAFGGAPIYVPALDRAWVTRPDDVIRWWDGEPRELAPGVTLIRTGGHFPGSAVLHWRDGAEGRGALFVGDSITVVPDRRYVSFMYSYPNLIPLPPAVVRQIVAAVEPYAFDRIYGGWWDRDVPTGAKESVRQSAARYIEVEEGKREF